MVDSSGIAECPEPNAPPHGIASSPPIMARFKMCSVRQKAALFRLLQIAAPEAGPGDVVEMGRVRMPDAAVFSALRLEPPAVPCAQRPHAGKVAYPPFYLLRRHGVQDETPRRIYCPDSSCKRYSHDAGVGVFLALRYGNVVFYYDELQRHPDGQPRYRWLAARDVDVVCEHGHAVELRGEHPPKLIAE